MTSFNRIVFQIDTFTCMSKKMSIISEAIDILLHIIKYPSLEQEQITRELPIPYLLIFKIFPTRIISTWVKRPIR